MPRMPEIIAIAHGDALARDLVADDPEREREDRAAEPLDRPRDDHQRQGGREAGQEAADGEARRAR